MKPDVDDTELSEVERAAQDRVRKTFEVEIPDILGHNKKPLGKIRMREATMAEQEETIKKAYEYASKNVSLKDPDSYENIKTVFMLHKVCLNITSDRPAFVGPEWMLKHFGVQELAILLNNYNEIKRVINSEKRIFDTPTLEAFAELCAKYTHSDAPNIFLNELNRDAVAEIAIRIGVLYHEMKTK